MASGDQEGAPHDSGVAWPARYRLCIKERLDAHWSEWLGEMAIGEDAAGRTLLEGVLVDQAALYGLISRLRDLGLTLLSVQRTDARAEQEEGRI